MSEEIKENIPPVPAAEDPVVLPTGEKLVLSSSPHLSSPESTARIMFLVLASLLPASIAGIWFFGIKAALVLIFSTFFCVAAEALWCLMVKRPILRTIGDGSAAVTGLLLGLNLPASVPFYVPLIGAFLAIWLGKQIFGGLGHNPFNPCVVARVGLLIALPAAMTTWDLPRGMNDKYPSIQEFRAQPDAVTCATPLSVASTTPKVLGKGPDAELNFSSVDNPDTLKAYFLGIKGGCIGEVCVPALLLGGILLVMFNLINWKVPVCYIGTVAIITGIVNYFCPGVTPSPLFHIVTGGLLLGAIFMATDMVTCPITGSGCVLFAVGCGVLTSVIRIWGNYPEGVSFSILFMNALVPLIDRWCGVRPFGYTVKHKKD